MAYNPVDFLKNLVPDDANMFGASPNANMRKMAEMGLLGDANYEDMLAKANKQSMFQGLLASGLSYAAQPKNQGYGSILPYLAKAGLSGMQAAQSPYDQMGKDAIMNQKLQDMKRARDIQASQDKFRESYGKPNVFEEVQKGYSPSTAPVAPDATGQSTAPNFGLVPNMETQGRFNPNVMMNEAVQSGALTFPQTLDYMLKQQELKAASDIAKRKAPKIETVREGDEEVSFTYNEKTGNFDEIARGSAFAPKEGKATHNNTPTELIVDGKVVNAYLPTGSGAIKGEKPIDATTNKPIDSGFSVKPKPFTETQSENSIHSSKMTAANNIFSNQLENEDGTLNYDPTAVNRQQVIGAYYLVGDASAALLNKYNLTPADRQAAQAKKTFINSILRKESGAAIAQSEFDNADSQYFPQFGDDKQTVINKRRTRELVTATMKAAISGDPAAIQEIDRISAELSLYNPSVKKGSASDAGGNEIAVGEVKQGYKFIGGDPNDKNSWQKVDNFTSNDIPQ